MKGICLIASIVLTFLIPACAPKSPPPASEPAPAKTTIVLSRYLKGRQDVVFNLIGWLESQGNRSIELIDGWDGTEITQFTVPTVNYFKPGVVVQRIGEPIRKLVAWNQSSIDNPKLAETGALAVPRLLERLAQGGTTPGALILIGSPVQRAPCDPTFAEPKLRYPSLGYLKATNSPFSCIGREHSLAGTQVHFLFPGEKTSDWTGTYEAHLRKFYGSFFASRGAALVSFTPDLEAGLRLASTDAGRPLEEFALAADLGPAKMIDEIQETAPAQPPTPANTNSLAKSMPPVKHEVSQPTNSEPAKAIAQAAQPPRVANAPEDTKTNVVIKPVSAANSPAVETNLVLITPAPAPFQIAIPEARPGVTIEIRYKSDSAAADLYVRPFAGAEEISFRQSATEFGVYNYQFDYAAGEHVKSIYLPGGCDPAKATAWINYSSGVGRLAGKVFWVSPEGPQEIPFSFAAFEGGDATQRREGSRRKSLRWFRVNLLDFTAAQPTSATSIYRPAARP